LYRVVLVTDRTASYDIELTFNGTVASHPQPLNRIAIVNAFQNYGNNTALMRIESFGKWLGLTYWNDKCKTLSAVTYYNDKLGVEVEDFILIVKLNQIKGGMEMNFDGFAEDHFDPFAFFFYRDINNNSMLWVNDPTPGKSSRVFTLNSDNITITSTTDLI